MTNKERYAGKKQLTVFVDETMFKKLKQLAKSKGMFFGKYVQKILIETMKKEI